MDTLSLSQLLDVAFGEPRVGVVDFLALRQLLQAVVGHLGLQAVTARELGHGLSLPLAGVLPGLEKGARAPGTGQQQQEPAEPVPGPEPLQGTGSSSLVASVAADVGQLKEKVEANESGISKAMAVTQDVLEEIGGMKVAQRRMAQDIRRLQEVLGLGNLQGADSQLPGFRDRPARESDMEGSGGGQSAPAEPPVSDKDTPRGGSSAPGTQPAPEGSAGTHVITPVAQPGPLSLQATVPGMPTTPTTAAEMQLGSPGTLTTPGAPAVSRSQELDVPCGSSGSGSSYSQSAEMTEALRQLGELGQLYSALEEQVAQLAASKSDQAEVEKLRRLLPAGGQESVARALAELQAQVSSLQGLAHGLQGLARGLQEEKEQIRPAPGHLGVAGDERRAGAINRSTVPLGSVPQELQRELQQLREQHEGTKAALEQLVTQTGDQLQVQLDELRALVESAGQEQAEEEQAEAPAACPACSTDASAKVGLVFQRIEKLQELVDSVVARQAVVKVARPLPRRSQDEEVLKRIRDSIVQVQGDCEKLSSVTGKLLHEQQQMQKEMEALFRSLGRLQKEKADKEDVELGIDVKADKAALAGKVSLVQFEACMERQKETMEEMLSRVTEQEQGWQQLQQQLREATESKLDRLELRPVRQQLEQCRSIVEQLQKARQAEGEDTAGVMKKPQLAHFHCLSCDRPLNVQVPGPHITTLPSMPPLVPHLARHPRHSTLQPDQPQQPGSREPAAERRYPVVSRQQGGRHTLTSPLQRCRHLQPHPPSTPRPSQLSFPLPSKHDEVELLGRDGRVCRGRRYRPAGTGGFPRDEPQPSPRQHGSSRPSSPHGPAAAPQQDWGSWAEPPPPRLPSGRVGGSSWLQ